MHFKARRVLSRTLAARALPEATTMADGGEHIAYPEKEYDAAAAPTTATDGDGGGAVYRDTNNVPRTPEGTTLHMELKEGDVAHRVLTVGDPARARRISAALDRVDFHKVSRRGFETYSGVFQGTPVSIVSIGMGFSMMDFFVRETRQIVDGPMLIVRFGTCGLVQRCVRAGSIVVASVGSVMILRNPDAFLPADTPKHATPPLSHEPYLIFHPQPADEPLSQALVKELTSGLGEATVVEGMNATACSFYSSQGRRDPSFADDNASLLDRLRGLYPSVLSMEMETYQLLALANSSRAPRTIRAAAASIGVANRPTGEVCSEATLDLLELEGGKCVLRALVSTPLT